MRTLLLTESSPDPFSCSLPANCVVGSTSRRVVVVCAWCNSRRYASSCSIEVKMLDFLDDKSFRVGTILGCDTCECHARDEDQEKRLHGFSLKDRVEPHGTQEIQKLVTPQK